MTDIADAILNSPKVPCEACGELVPSATLLYMSWFDRRMVCASCGLGGSKPSFMDMVKKWKKNIRDNGEDV